MRWSGGCNLVWRLYVPYWARIPRKAIKVASSTADSGKGLAWMTLSFQTSIALQCPSDCVRPYRVCSHCFADRPLLPVPVVLAFCSSLPLIMTSFRHPLEVSRRGMAVVCVVQVVAFIQSNALRVTRYTQLCIDIYCM